MNSPLGIPFWRNYGDGDDEVELYKTIRIGGPLRLHKNTKKQPDKPFSYYIYEASVSSQKNIKNRYMR